ncbi:LOW QUALITY PROTEIN: immunoglobulin superfamily member 22 [Amazona ochrocephala]
MSTDAIYTVPLIMTEEFQWKELKFDHKYEIITSDDGLTHTVKTESFQFSDFEEPSIETGDLVLNTLLFINNVQEQLNIRSMFVSMLEASGPKEVQLLATASIKVPFKAKPVPKVTFKDDIEVTEEEKAVMEKTTAHTADKPKPPQGKAEFLQHTRKYEMRWKAPKGGGGEQVTHFVMERKMTGGKIVDRSRGGEQLHHICCGKGGGRERLVIQNKPLREVSQPQVVDARKESVPITWNSPALHGGSPVKGYVIEKRKKGSSLCFPVTEEPVQGTRFKEDGFLADTDELRVIAVNYVGPGLLSMPSTSHCERTHQSVCFCDYLMSSFSMPPGLPEMVDFSNSNILLAWLEPDQEDVMSGYILEMAENTKKWTKCTKISLSSTIYTVGGSFDTTVRLKSHMVQTDYCVLKCDVSSATWFTAAEVYSNKYIVTGLLPGRKTSVIVCNDTGDTDPLDSQEQWYISKDRGELHTLFPCSSVGSLPQETVLHKQFQRGSFPQATVLHELLQRESLPWGAVLQEQTAPTWVLHSVTSPASKPAPAQAPLSMGHRSC